MTVAPQSIRLQLSRRQGFNLQTHSRAVNGLEAINCARPGKWGNPWPVGSRTAAEVVGFYADALSGAIPFKILAGLMKGPSGKLQRDYLEGVIENIKALPVHELRGKNLACWCALGEPCHADVLLELANK